VIVEGVSAGELGHVGKKAYSFCFFAAVDTDARFSAQWANSSMSFSKR
jgi:hypothetical protein